MQEKESNNKYQGILIRYSLLIITAIYDRTISQADVAFFVIAGCYWPTDDELTSEVDNN